jgi:hypothetical protein
MGKDRERTPGFKDPVIHGLETAAATFACAAIASSP